MKKSSCGFEPGWEMREEDKLSLHAEALSHFSTDRDQELKPYHFY